MTSKRHQSGKCFNCGCFNCYCNLTSSKELSEQIKILNGWKPAPRKPAVKKKSSTKVPTSAISTPIKSKPSPLKRKPIRWYPDPTRSVSKLLQSIPMKYQYSAFGYIRNIEKELSILQVPNLISNLILEYYFHGEYFVAAGKGYKISDDKLSIKRVIESDGWPNMVVGNMVIPWTLNQRIRWTFNVKSFGIYHYFNGIYTKQVEANIEIGVVTDYDTLNGWQTIFGTPKPNGGNRWKEGELETNTNFTFSFHPKEDIEIRTKSGIMCTFYIKQNPYKNVNYKLAVCMNGKGAEIDLIDVEMN